MQTENQSAAPGDSSATNGGDPSSTPPGDTQGQPPANSSDDAPPNDDANANANASDDNGEGNGEAPTYTDFTIPAGIEIDTAALERYTPVFQELGLTQEQAQRLVDLRAEEVRAMNEGAAEQAEQWFAERLAAERTQQSEADLAALRADKQLGGDKFEEVHKRVTDFIGEKGSVALREQFDKLNLGNNPELARLFYDIATNGYQPQDRGEGAGSGGGDKPTLAHRMYRNAKM